MNGDQGKERWGKWSNRKRKGFQERGRDTEGHDF